MVAGITALVKKPELHTQEKEHAFELWRPNDESKFSKMFSEDYRVFGLADLIEEEELNNLMKNFYEKYYPGLFYIFLKYQSTSMTYPGLSWMEMNQLMLKCGFFDEDFTELETDQIFQDVSFTVSSVLEKDNFNVKYDSAKFGLLRGGFMSFLARAALIKFHSCIFLLIRRNNFRSFRSS